MTIQLVNGFQSEIHKRKHTKNEIKNYTFHLKDTCLDKNANISKFKQTTMRTKIKTQIKLARNKEEEESSIDNTKKNIKAKLR